MTQTRPTITIEEAKLTWKLFHERYKDLRSTETKPVPPSEIKKSFFMQSHSQGKKDTAARVILRNWLALRKSDKLVKVRTGKRHSSLFKYFLNNDKNDKPIEKSLNKIKLTALEAALRRADWEHEIFSDVQLPQLVISLFSSDKISYQQCSSVLEYKQIKDEFKNITVHYMLNAQQQLSDSTLKLLLPILNANGRRKVEALECLQVLLTQLPSSEQVFFLTDAGNYKDYSLGANRSLAEILITNQAIYFANENRIFHLSAGARDAIGIAKIGLDNYIRLMPRIGKQSVDDIEYAVRNGARPAAIAFPKTKAFDEKIHKWSDVTPWVATQHDYYHCLVSMVMPLEIRQAFFLSLAVVREYTGIKWSSESWSWIDGEYHHLYNTEEKPYHMTKPADFTYHFYRLIQSKPHLIDAGYKGSLTATGIVILIDMLENPEKWLATQINPGLSGSLLGFY